MPISGHIIDLGCGWGLFSFALAAGSRNREVTGVDHDSVRIRLATLEAQRQPVTRRPNFQLGDAVNHLEKLPAASVDGIAMIDMLHYLDPGTQQAVIADARRALKPGGTLLAREIDADDGMRAALNKLYERLATGVGFTKSAGRELVFRSRRGWTELLERAGFRVESGRCGSSLLADVLFIASRKL